MKTILRKGAYFAALMLAVALGCDDDDNGAVEEVAADAAVNDNVEDAAVGGETADAATDDGKAPASCENREADFPGEYHCNYKTAFVQKNCYEYAKGVSRADAEAECNKHLQGGPGGLATNTRVFGEGPCSLTCRATIRPPH